MQLQLQNELIKFGCMLVTYYVWKYELEKRRAKGHSRRRAGSIAIYLGGLLLNTLIPYPFPSPASSSCRWSKQWPYFSVQFAISLQRGTPLTDLPCPGRTFSTTVGADSDCGGTGCIWSLNLFEVSDLKLGPIDQFAYLTAALRRTLNPEIVVIFVVLDGQGRDWR